MMDVLSVESCVQAGKPDQSRFRSPFAPMSIMAAAEESCPKNPEILPIEQFLTGPTPAGV